MRWTLEQRPAVCHPISDLFARRQGQPFTTGESNRYSCASEFNADIICKVGGGGAYAPPLPNFQTGMPSFRALSAMFSWMPVPGKTRTPIGSTSSI
jgi:hypothetical protein